MKKALIFLDFDGVLNSEQSDFGTDFNHSIKSLSLDRANIIWFHSMMEQLIQDGIEFEIVLSTSWGCNKSFDSFITELRAKIDIHRSKEEDMFNNILLHCTGKTPTFDLPLSKHNHKSPEIEHSLLCNRVDAGEVFIIVIDDEYVELFHHPYFMCMTHMSKGFTEVEKDMLVSLIRKKVGATNDCKTHLGK